LYQELYSLLSHEHCIHCSALRKDKVQSVTSILHATQSHQNFNCPFCNLRLNGKSLKEWCLLWSKRCTLARHCDINSCNGSSFGWCSNLAHQIQQYTEWDIQNRPLRSCRLYRICACLAVKKQYNILIGVSFYIRRNQNLINVFKFCTKILWQNHQSTPEAIFSQWQNTLVTMCLCPWQLLTQPDIAVRFQISLQLLLDPGLPSWLHISSVTCLRFCSGSLWSSITNLPFNHNFILSILHWSSTELTAHVLTENFTNTFVLHPLL